MPNLMNKLLVGSFFVYPTQRGTSALAFRDLVQYVKANDPSILRGVVDLIAAFPRSHELVQYVTRADVLVPVPTHVPTNSRDLWVAMRFCRHLLRIGLGEKLHPLLRRVKPVPQSSKARFAAERPDPNVHFESLTVTDTGNSYTSILLVDDVVTRGSTLIGCASRLHKQMPSADIRALAMFRTDRSGRPANLKQLEGLVQPRIETVRYDASSGRLRRE